MHTAVFSDEFVKQGTWYSSCHAVWEILDFKKDRLLLKGAWPYLPITQVWELAPKENCFAWKVDIDIFAPVYIKKQRAGIMFTEDYNCWEVSGLCSGMFPAEFCPVAWENLYRGRGSKLGLSRKAEQPGETQLPRIYFSCFQKGDDFDAALENSSSAFNGRQLTFEKISGNESQVIGPAAHRYFHGEITFG